MARAKKKTAKRKRSKKGVARRRAIAVPTAPGVPRRKKGESLVGYHDRLSDLIYEADAAGDLDYSEALQKKAGEIARQRPSIRQPRRGKPKPRRGPGTYPWYQCMDDQAPRYGKKRAAQVCGRIRASSRQRYPVYWSAREGKKPKRNPAFPDAATSAEDYAIFVGDDEAGWHFWVLDQRTLGLAAASAKPYSSEGRALGAAKRAAKVWHERRYPPQATKGRKSTGKPGRQRLPSILSRM